MIWQTMLDEQYYKILKYVIEAYIEGEKIVNLNK